MSDEVLIGVFGAPHGVRGEIRVKSYTQDPLSLADYKGLHDAQGAPIKIATARLLKDDLLVVRLKGVDNRDAAQKLTHAKIFINSADLPETGEEEFYTRDLIGLRAELESGDLIGTIVAVPNYGAGDILEVAPPAGETLLYPFTRAVVPTVDIKGGRVIIAPPVETNGDE